MRNKISQINASILVNAIYAMANYPILLVNSLLAPLSVLTVVTFASKGRLIGTAVLGALIMNIVSNGTSLQSDLSHLKNDMRVQDMVVSSPTSDKIYIAGMAISELVYSIPTLALIVALNLIFVHITWINWLMIIADMALLFLFSISLGFFLSTVSSDIVQSWGFTGVLSPLLTTLPPVYYPIYYIPYPFRYISYLSPTTYAAEIAQSEAGYLSLNFNGFLVSWIILVGFTIVLLYLALKRSRWREV